MNNKKVLITGGAGFIGSNLALSLQKQYPDCSIVVVDKFNNQERFKNNNFKFLGSFENLINFEGDILTLDIRDKEGMTSLEKFKFDFIFHMAAISDTRAENENEVLENNVQTFYSIIEKAEKDGAKLIYASSGATYGSKISVENKIGDESPDNIYGFSKLTMDRLSNSYLKNNPKIEIVGLRYFNVYGPGEWSKLKTASTILQFSKQFIDKGYAELFENSDQIFRDFIFIDDVIKFTIKAASEGIAGIYNLGSGKERSFYDVASIISNELGSKYKIRYIKNPYTRGYQSFTKADISKTVKDFNLSAGYSLEEGIKNYLPIILGRYEKEI